MVRDNFAMRDKILSAPLVYICSPIVVGVLRVAE